MYAVDVYEETREKYEERIINVSKNNDVFDTVFDVEFDEENNKKLYFFRAWCNDRRA